MPFLSPDLPLGQYGLMAAAALCGMAFSLAVRERLVLSSVKLSGAPARKTVLYLWGGVPVKRAGDPFSTGTELREMGIAVLASLLLAGILLLGFARGTGPDVPLAVTAVLLRLSLFNALIAALTLLPVYPLRGGRLVVALVASRRGTQAAAQWGKGLGLAGASVFTAAGIWRLWEEATLTGATMIVVSAHLAFAAIIHARKERNGV